MFQTVGDETRPLLFVMRSLDEAYTHAKLSPPVYKPINESQLRVGSD